MLRISYWPTREAAERQAAEVEASEPGGTYHIVKIRPGQWEFSVEPRGPKLLYDLELDAEELSALHNLLHWHGGTETESGALSPGERSITEKVLRLMEGR